MGTAVPETQARRVRSEVRKDLRCEESERYRMSQSVTSYEREALMRGSRVSNGSWGLRNRSTIL